MRRARSGRQDSTETKGGAVRAAKAAIVALAVTLGVLMSGMAAADAAVTELRPVQPASGGFLGLHTMTSSLAIDGPGAAHVAFNRKTSAGEGASYAYCAPQTECRSAQHWAQVHLVSDVDEMKAPAQLELTPAGQPRILMAVGAPNNDTTYRYAACDSACTTAAGWTVLDLGSVFNKPGDIWGVARDHSFALDPQGRPRFVYSCQACGLDRLYYAACDTGCASSVANWTLTTVSQGTTTDQPLSITYDSLSLDFTAAGQPRVAAYISEMQWPDPDVDKVAYLECDAACSAPEPSTPPHPNWRVTAVGDPHGTSLVMRLDNADAPHIMAASGYPGEQGLRWFWCAAGCSATSGWSSALIGIAGTDPDLQFDRQNRPHVAFRGSVAGGVAGPAYAWCTAGCDSPGPVWKAQQIDDSRAFQAEYPLTGSPCSTGTWLVGFAPSMALDAAGNPRISFSGEHVYNTCTGNMLTNGMAVRVDRFNFFPRPADFDGNARTDVSVFRPSTGTWWVDGQFARSWGANGDVPVPGDYNGDGKTDVAVFRPSTGTWWVQGQFARSWGAQRDVPVPGDYDGDGKTDVAVFRPSTGTWWVDGQFARSWGAQGDVPVPGDYDGDHITDVAVFRPSTGTWWVQGQFARSWGGNGDVPVPGDYDGDGTTDVAVFRPSTGTWWVHGQFAKQWGGNGDVPVPGDYDGDGKTDVAVFRPSTGTWWVQGQFVRPWGASGDIALPLPAAAQPSPPAG